MINQEIKRGKYNPYYPLSELKMASINRDTVIKHAENFKLKLKNFGWMMPVVISSKGDVIEGHHRIQSAKFLNQSTIPAYIVDWIDTDKEKEHLDCIINLNNGNKAWTNVDYLKAFAKENEEYSIVYEAYLRHNKMLSVGNIINCFFGQFSASRFKKGSANIKNEELAYYLLEKLSNLVLKHTKSKIQAFSIRELIAIAYSKENVDYNVMDYIISEYDDMASINHPKLTSITEFKKHIQSKITMYNNIKNH